MEIWHQIDTPVPEKKLKWKSPLLFPLKNLLCEFEIDIQTVNKMSNPPKMTKKAIPVVGAGNSLVFSKLCCLLGTVMNQVIYCGTSVQACINSLTVENCHLHIYQCPDKKMYPNVAKTMLKIVYILY